ncbi:glycosyltransferase family 2 protein [Neobacillus soli]|uniref:glycosyltransferase family 2 protein n=1 Tax=Neobacillus soli TaxID=220688 RepID=UPI000824608D|nr:glycosyltransferase family 2 protein [Neobacillus soli]
MFENVSIIIPFQTDHGPREEAFEWLKRYYAAVMPDAELCLGVYNGSEFNKSKAVNRAAKMATKDIFVIADADIVYDPRIILKAIELLKEAAWVVPFTEIYDIPMEATKYLLRKQPKWPLRVGIEECNKANWIYEGFAGKLNVIPRANFEAVGGFDERFVGWGGEDDAFSHSVNTLCGQFVNCDAKIFHLWHPASHYVTNPNGEANKRLLKRYISASGNKNKMAKLMNERGVYLENNKRNIPENFNRNTNSSNSKICFMILVHNRRDLIKELINNVRYYCPNSTVVLYNGGDDPTLCDNLGVPVCPASRKLERGFTTIYFLETMEWLEEMRMDYQYLINIDSDALFIRNGYEQFIQREMNDTDYMAVKLRIPEKDWYIGNELKKDINRWKSLFNVDPFYGIFNVGQVFNRSLVKALIHPERKEKLKRALLKTISFGTDEIFYVNMARELGFRIKNYPNHTDEMMIRYRPYFTLDEMIRSLNEIKNSWLCHPIYREKDDLVRKLIKHLGTEHYGKKYLSKEYPWYQSNQMNYAPSLPIVSSFGSEEIIVRSGSYLTHYWQHQKDKKWYKSETFAKGVTGTPVMYETATGQFEVVSKLAAGGIALWWRENLENGQQWHGPFRILNEDVDPIMLAQLEDGRPILICKSGEKLIKLVWD